MGTSDQLLEVLDQLAIAIADRDDQVCMPDVRIKAFDPNTITLGGEGNLNAPSQGAKGFPIISSIYPRRAVADM